MAPDITYYDPETHYVYRITARRLTMRDGAAVDEAQADLARRDLPDAEFLMLRQYPLVRFGTREAERAQLEGVPEFQNRELVLPEGLSWEPYLPTEDEFADLDELLGRLWVGAVITRNPHRDLSYEVLKKRVSTEAPPTPSSGTTSGSGTGGSTPATT